MKLKRFFKLNIPFAVLKRLEQNISRYTNSLFWVFNAILALILVSNEFSKDFFDPIIYRWVEGYSIGYTSIYTLGLYLMLVFALFIGIKFKEELKIKQQVLFKIEIPLLLLAYIRQEMFYSLSLSISYLFALLLLFILAHSILIFFTSEKIRYYGSIFQTIKTLLLHKLSIFFSSIFFITIIPLTVALLTFTLHLKFLDKAGIFTYLIINILILIALTLLLKPVLSMLRYSWRKLRQQLFKLNKKHRYIYLSFSLILFSGLYFLNIQNNNYSFLQFSEKPNSSEEKEFFFNNKTQIEQELRQAINIKYQYLGSVQNNFFCDIIAYEFKLDEKQTKLLNSAYNGLMYPFFYQPKGSVDYSFESHAKNMYEELFDSTINTYNYYWEPPTYVHIDQQEISVKEHGDIAEIEICESYSTDTGFTEEVIMHFELPNNSVITGLWISDDKNIDKKYSGIVAPSGAAEKVYFKEVRKRVDPALLNQIGENQYSLRAFPILNKNRFAPDSLIDGTLAKDYQFRLWYSYKTFISKDKQWQLPKLLNQENIFWSDSSSLFINGKFVQRPEQWLPEYIVAQHPESIKSHSSIISDSLQIVSKQIVAEDYFNFDANIALLIDGSYSMDSYREELAKKINEIKPLFSNLDEMDCYIVGNEIQKMKVGGLSYELKNNPYLFFGHADYMDMLELYTTNIKDYAQKYELIILISDITDFWHDEWEYYDFEQDTTKVIKLDCPFVLCNISGAFEQAHARDYLKRIVKQSKGGFAYKTNELINLLNLNIGHDKKLLTYQEPFVYLKSDTSNPNDSIFKALATKAFINHYRPKDSVNLAEIDRLNTLAKKENIVTRYSSMIALVNQTQIDSLRSAETQLDRYNDVRIANSSSMGGSSGVLGLLDMWNPIPKYPENMVIFSFLILIGFMLYGERFKP